MKTLEDYIPEGDNTKIAFRSVSELSKVVLGGTPSTTIKEYWNGDINWASAKDIASNGERYIYSTERTISELGLQNSSAKICPRGTIVITSRGTVGKMAILPFNMSFNQTCYGLIAKENTDYLYLYYALIYSLQNIESLTYGTVFDTITIKTFNDLFLPYPEEEIRKTIASILDVLDSKIELNNQINSTLETLAQSLFHSWFVRFNPFQDGEFVDSEFGPIPKGWEVLFLEQLLDSLESGKRPKGGVKHITEGIPSIGAENIDGLGKYEYSKEKYVSREFFEKMKQGVVRSGDVLLYKDGAYIGKKSLFMENYPYETCCINEHVFILRPNALLPSSIYLYFWLDQEYMTQTIVNLNSGGVQPGLNQSSVKSLKVLVANLEILQNFDTFVYPLINRIMINGLMNKKLSSFRNLLLPQLLSGKLKIKNPKHFLEEISNEN